MRMRRSTTVIGFAALLSAIVGAAGAHTAPSSHIETLTVSPSGGSIAVSGSASFVSVPSLLSSDPSNDARAPGIGAELTGLTVGRTSAGHLSIALGVADQPGPAGNGIPEAVTYQHRFEVTTAGVTSLWELRASRSLTEYDPLLVGTVPPWTPEFTVSECKAPGTVPAVPPNSSTCDGVNTDGTVKLSGSMGGGIVEWIVPLASIRAGVGSQIRATRIVAAASASSMLTSDTYYDEVAPSANPFSVVGPTVRVGIDVAGTPVEEVPLTVDASLNAGSGAFSASLASPAAGSHVVVARACYGDNSCGLSSRTVSL